MAAVSPSDADDDESCLIRRVTADPIARKAAVPKGTSAAEPAVTVGAARPTVSWQEPEDGRAGRHESAVFRNPLQRGGPADRRPPLELLIDIPQTRRGA